MPSNGTGLFPNRDYHIHKYTGAAMRAVVQRVSRASVLAEGTVCGQIGPGLAVLVGICPADQDSDVQWLADKLVHLRIFNDLQGRMNRSLLDVQGQLLIVSQFTLFGDCRRGRRPSWSQAAGPDLAKPRYLELIDACQRLGIETASGIFQAEMQLSLVNDGPVTLILDSRTP
jgi:D-aminoacyl-tRNA deacylase